MFRSRRCPTKTANRICVGHKNVAVPSIAAVASLPLLALSPLLEKKIGWIAASRKFSSFKIELLCRPNKYCIGRAPTNTLGQPLTHTLTEQGQEPTNVHESTHTHMFKHTHRQIYTQVHKWTQAQKTQTPYNTKMNINTIAKANALKPTWTPTPKYTHTLMHIHSR